MVRLNRPVLTFILVAILLLVAAHALDHLAYRWLYDPHVYDRDWGRMLRTMGFLPFWMLGALALALQDGVRLGRQESAPPGVGDGGAGAAETAGAARPSMPQDTVAAGSARAGRQGAAGRFAASRAGFLLLSPIVAGILGELLKLVVRRERPWAAAGAYVFRPFSDRPFYGGGLSMPSSHSVVAFGAACALARLFPRAAPVWYLLAAGCAYTRVAARAHFLSDVVAGALLSWLVVALLWRWSRRAIAAA